MKKEQAGLSRYLSPLNVWALSFGCAVGWGSFVMPGTTFLPAAGPLGTALGLFIGVLVMWVIGVNYYYLMNRFPDSGGTLTYSIEAFGYDHGFLSAWFLLLVYIAIIWANATALALIGRNLLGSMFQFGFHYQVLGYDVYLGEILLTLSAILIFGIVCIKGKKLAVGMQTVLALFLFLGILFTFLGVFFSRSGDAVSLSPLFAPGDKNPIEQIIVIFVLSPWAFAGFESVSNSVSGFKFSVKKSLYVMTAALFTGVLAYIFLSLMAAGVQPRGYRDWSQYIGDLQNLSGVGGLPVFHAVHRNMGPVWVSFLALVACAGIITGLVGNYIAASRLMYSMSQDGILPKWFGELNKEAIPGNAMLFLMGISVFVPFLGRTAIGWIIDVNTIGATVAYGYTSAAALACALKEGDKKVRITGITGIAASVIFFIYFMVISTNAMSTESYLILAAWSILGFVYFRQVFSKDKEGRFGKSTVVWIGLLFLIFLTSLLWVRKATGEMTRQVVKNISDYYEEEGIENDRATVARTERYLAEQMEKANDQLVRNSIIQMAMIVAALAIMLNVYGIMSRRQKEAELQRQIAEESSKAKTIFLSNMSHDIRTPMNAIIGYINLSKQQDPTREQLKEYLGKIEYSSRHLLALINDVLEMSRIESGKMNLEPIAVDLKKSINEVRDMFLTQMEEKHIGFSVDVAHIKRPHVYCDKNRLNRVLLNLLSNAYKFTPEYGTVSVSAWEIESLEEGYGKYELRVKDSGIGMTDEFAARVFEAFERERNSTVSGIEGTGLGMAITKSIVDLMQGSIVVNTAPNKGTEFVITLPLRLQEGKEAEPEEGLAEAEAPESELDFSKMRLLLVEDMMVNREIATMLLKNLGFAVETAENGKEGVDKVAVSTPGYYNAVLMDIQMPVMDGYEATRTIRRLENGELAKIPIIAMTANAFSEDVKKAHDAGMNGHIAKPIDMDNLLRTLKEVLV